MNTLLCRGGVPRDCRCGHVWSAMGFSLVGVYVHVCSAVGLWVLYMCVIVGVYMCVIVGVYMCVIVGVYMCVIVGVYMCVIVGVYMCVIVGVYVSGEPRD